MKVKQLLKNNQSWSARINANEPDFFPSLARQQKPEFLWIGCSDSRVPANEIVDLQPGELFVHRNVANLVIHTDFNCLSVIQYAVDVLEVKHIIVCGHYKCGGILSALKDNTSGLINNWLRHVQDLIKTHRMDFDRVPEDKMADCLCELNVVAQVENVANTSIVKEAWNRGQLLKLHGWVYGLDDGLIKDLDVTISKAAATRKAVLKAMRRVLTVV